MKIMLEADTSSGMKKLIVVVNDLERSGKSSVACAIYHHLSSECEIESLFVTSDENHLTEEFRGDFWDLDEDLSFSTVADAFEGNDAVVVDLHTGGARRWADFCESSGIDHMLAEEGAEMTLVIPNTGGMRCNEEIIDIAELFSDLADYVIAHLPMAERDGVKWKGSDAEKTTRYLGAIDVNFPAVTDELRAALVSIDSSLALALDKPEELPRFAEVQISQWLEEVSQRLVGAEEYLVADSEELALEY